jgi:hypothetical protein
MAASDAASDLMFCCPCCCAPAGVTGPGRADVLPLTGISVCVTGKCYNQVLGERHVVEIYIQDK